MSSTTVRLQESQIVAIIEGSALVLRTRPIETVLLVLGTIKRRGATEIAATQILTFRAQSIGAKRLLELEIIAVIKDVALLIGAGSIETVLLVGGTII